MKSDREPLLEITATDPAGIAAQQEVLDAFDAADEAMGDIEIGCMALDAALDSAGAPRISKEQFYKERDELFAQFERERQLKKKRKR